MQELVADDAPRNLELVPRSLPAVRVPNRDHIAQAAAPEASQRNRLRARECECSVLGSLLAPTDAELLKLQASALTLGTRCLEYDFLGGFIEDTNDDVTVSVSFVIVLHSLLTSPLCLRAQLPKPWRPIIEDPSLLALLFELFNALAARAGDKNAPAELSSQCCKCLQLLYKLCSIRRSLFIGDGSSSNNADAEPSEQPNECLTRFLTAVCEGTAAVINKFIRTLISDAEIQFQFCQLLARLRTTFMTVGATSKLRVRNHMLSVLSRFHATEFAAELAAARRAAVCPVLPEQAGKWQCAPLPGRLLEQVR